MDNSEIAMLAARIQSRDPDAFTDFWLHVKPDAKRIILSRMKKEGISTRSHAFDEIESAVMLKLSELCAKIIERDRIEWQRENGAAYLGVCFRQAAEAACIAVKHGKGRSQIATSKRRNERDEPEPKVVPLHGCEGKDDKSIELMEILEEIMASCHDVMDRQIVELRYLGESIGEIAKIVKRHPNTVANRLTEILGRYGARNPESAGVSSSSSAGAPLRVVA